MATKRSTDPERIRRYEIEKRSNAKHIVSRRKLCRDWRRRVRLEVIAFYSQGSNKCACCGEDKIEFLAIDHIHGGGHQQRTVMRATNGGTALCLWLRKNGFPYGYQVLCHNCNLSLGFYGYCPHQKQRQLELPRLT